VLYFNYYSTLTTLDTMSYIVTPSPYSADVSGMNIVDFVNNVLPLHNQFTGLYSNLYYEYYKKCLYCDPMACMFSLSSLRVKNPKIIKIQTDDTFQFYNENREKKDTTTFYLVLPEQLNHDLSHIKDISKFNVFTNNVTRFEYNVVRKITSIELL
jgi:hypothetical protein